MTPEEAVAAYIRKYRVGARAEMHEFETEPTLCLAIRRAALCLLSNGKRHPHQYRIPRFVLEQGEARLQAIATKLQRSADFAALHDLIEAEIKGIDGIAELTTYDIAHRIGAYLKKAPEQVYLHRGTRTGTALFGLRGRTIKPAQLPAAFSRLAPAEIEDCLCIYKGRLRNGRSGASRSICLRTGLNPRGQSEIPTMRGCIR